MSVWSRMQAAMADPWVLLTAGLGGGTAWAIGIPVVGASAVGAVMLGGAAAAAALLREPKDEAEEKPVALRPGTAQAGLVDALAGYLRDLAELRASRLPQAVTDSAIEALVATGGAHLQAVKVAAAVDRLDDAIQRGEAVAHGRTGTPPVGVWQSVERMKARRDALLGRLDTATGQVAEVYTKLLELSATVDTIDMAGAAGSDINQVNGSLDALQSAFMELERDASRLD